MTTIGFTGTRKGMTEAQHEYVTRLLAEWKFARPAVFAVHGDCIGADSEFDALCERIGIDRGCRPCTLRDMRANTGARELAKPKSPMARNRDIVKDITADGMLVACPYNYDRLTRGSGTWATIGFGEDAGKSVVIVYPNGRTEHSPVSARQADKVAQGR